MEEGISMEFLGKIILDLLKDLLMPTSFLRHIAVHRFEVQNCYSHLATA